MSDGVEGAGWPQVYVESRNRVAGMLTGIRRRSERAKGCLKVLVDASAALTSRAPAAIGAPSAEHAIALAEIAGAAWAARDVLEHGPARPVNPDPQFEAWLARRSRAWGGQLASGLMAASDGEMGRLLYSGALPELQGAADAGRSPEISWLVDPAFKIDHAAAFLAELNAGARPRPAAVHQARAEALDQQLATTYGYQGTHRSAHAFAVHYLTGIYGPGGDALRTTMLRFIATYPPQERATLQASKVAALLSDALGSRAKMALLDQIILSLGPDDGDPSLLMRFASDSAVVLLLLEEDDVEPGEQTDVGMPIAVEAPRGSSAQPPTDGPDPALPLVGGDAAHGPAAGSADWIAEIAGEAERAIVAASAERQARYQRAVDAGSLTDALVVVRDAAVDDDHEQAWSLLQDIARRHPDADPGGLVTVAPDILGHVDLDSDGDFDGPGAGCFTVLSPAPAAAGAAIARVAPRLLNVDDRGTEHPDYDTAATSDAYTPNFLHGVVWCDRGAGVTLDTKGSISAPMARTMVAILSQALVETRVPALITGWIPDLDDSMTRWDNDD